MTFALRRAAPLAVVLSALTLAACGGSGTDGGDIDENDLALQANAICTTYNTKSRAVAVPTDAKSASAAAAYYAQITALAKQQHRELNALSASGDTGRDWDAYLELDRQGLVLFTAITNAAKANDEPAAERLLPQIDALGERAKDAADKVGATSCGSKAQ